MITYKSKYTGEQVDEAVGKMLSGEDIPTKTSQLENDSNFITSEDVAAVAISGSYNDLHDTPTIPNKTSDLINDNGLVDEQTLNTALEDYTLNDDGYAVADGLRDSDDLIFYLPTAAPDDTDRMLLTNGSLKTINGQSIVGSGDIVIEGGSSSSGIAYAEYTGTSTDVVVTTVYGDFPDTLVEGARVSVKIEGSITLIKTLNVNGTGAKNVYYKGSSLASGTISRYNTYDFIYDGSYYRVIGVDTNTDTHYTAKNVVTSSSTSKSNAAAGNGNVYLNVIENSAVRSATNIVGSGATSVTSDANGKITIDTQIKTINGESIVGSGNISISGGGGSSDANVQAVDTGDVIDDVTVNYATKTYVDGLVGDINSVLESIIIGSHGGGAIN